MQRQADDDYRRSRKPGLAGTASSFCLPLKMNRDIVGQVRTLFRDGQIQRGVSALGDAARQGNASALEYLAGLCLEGSYVERDLQLSRDLFRRAAEAGSASAAASYRAFVANGTGGAADWLASIELLRLAARTDASADRELELIEAMRLDENGDPTNAIACRTVSNCPDVSEFPAMFTEAECDWLIDISGPALTPSLVVDPNTGTHIPNPVRTSDAMGFPWVAEGPAIHALCRRLADASGTKVNQGEPLQVLRYHVGQEYKPHVDAIANSDNQRTFTFLVYLNDDYSGGETEFPRKGIRIKGRKGDGLLFRNADKSGRPDPNSLHAGLPVISGAKYLASRWIRERPFGPV